MILASSLILSIISSYQMIHPVQLLQYSSLILLTISSYLRSHPVQLLQCDLELLIYPLHHLILPQDPSSPVPPE
jgi:hypothetical protein